MADTFDRLTGALERLQWQTEAMTVLLGAGEAELAARLSYAADEMASQARELVRQMADDKARAVVRQMHPCV